MLKIENIHLAYKKNRVLKGLNLELVPNKIHGIVGLNGSGKTTLLNSLYGKLKPQQGTFTFQKELLHHSKIGFLPTQNFFYARITGKEYLDLFTINNPTFPLEKWNEVFQLPLDKFVETYSTGMRKKLAFIGIMSLDLPIVILDEPFNGLDLEINETVKKILRLLKSENRIIIVTSHILEILTNICDEIHYLNDGTIEISYESDGFHHLQDKLAKFQYEHLEALVGKA